MEGLIRDVGEEKAMRLLKQVMENNMLLLNLQRQILKYIGITDGRGLEKKEAAEKRMEEKRRKEREKMTNGEEWKK